ncbi:MAG: isoaspartyl peptidase/L-asparaginase [Gammaproteobacteria bacterium]|nr:isoaspartyl peptidase/L-asparaginase [Gammaproteobacteria bacterium]
MTFTIIVHGGAGAVDPSSLETRRQGCLAAAQAGLRILAAGGLALDAVQAAVVALEDNPLFNAGTGSTLNREGLVETDAAIMDGSNLRAGAVAAVSGIHNPIQLARAVMEHSPHVLLAGEGAYVFAKHHGVATCNPDELIVPAQRNHWHEKHGTVGAVALDTHGRLASATSTGGVFDKLPGRIGDTPLIGCGTYANLQAAVSCTGLGEDITRTTLARHAAYLVEQGMMVAEAAARAISEFSAATGSEAGLILVDRSGRTAHARNTSNMPVCAMHADGHTDLQS